MIRSLSRKPGVLLVFVSAAAMRDSFIDILPRLIFLWARWQSGHAAACKAVYAGSIPTLASKTAFADPRGAPRKPSKDAEASHFALRRHSPTFVDILHRSGVSSRGNTTWKARRGPVTPRAEALRHRDTGRQ